MSDIIWIHRTIETRLVRCLWRDKSTGMHYESEQSRNYDDALVLSFYEESEYGIITWDESLRGDPNVTNVLFTSNSSPTAEYHRVIKEWQQ